MTTSNESKIFLLAERELYELSEKKELLLENLESNRLELEEAQALETMKPGSISGMYGVICHVATGLI